MTQRNRGFTLIELLVVIAIIGILASVVLASLSRARDKANIASVKSNLSGVLAQSTLYYDDNSQAYGAADAVGLCNTTSGTMFDADVTLGKAWSQAEQSGDGAAYCGVGINGQSWLVYVGYKDSSGWWCLDSTGVGTSTIADPTGGAGYAGAVTANVTCPD